jgi:tetratricopeptide (TPR) repeat protein
MGTDMQFDKEEILALAREHFEQNRVEDALGRVKQLLEDDVAVPGARELAARIYIRLRLYDRAIALLQQCLELDPESLERQLELAMVYQDSGDLDIALDCWDALLRRHPLMPPALFNAAWLLAQKKQFADASRHIEVLLQTAAEDNLYVGKARELQRTLSGRSSSPIRLS